MQTVHFTFDTGDAFVGETDGTRWNGFLNVRVTAPVLDEIVAMFARIEPGEESSQRDYWPPVECGWADLRGGFATIEATCDCGHPSRDHQSGDGPWTGFCGGTLGSTRDYYDRIPEGSDPAEPCSCEAFTYEGGQTR